jgi:geranylgeranyl transferase type-2 subunit beta
MSDYLAALSIRLAEGVARLPDAVRRRHASFFRGAQRPDGGFSGRDGASDLYYTSFGLRGLAVLGELSGPPAEGAAAYLKSRRFGRAPIVDFLSMLWSGALLESSAGIDVLADAPAGWHGAVAGALEAFRRPDGGYAKTEQGAAGSTYHSFLVLLCYQRLELPFPAPERLIAFLRGQQREDGGFVELGPIRRGGTNPTAAAVAALRILGGLDAPLADAAAGFLAAMQTEEGGLRANTRIPVADLLSTFTGTVALADLGALDRIDTAAALRYADSLSSPGGGFFAAAWDQAVDVEYSFYGLGTLALLAGRLTA